MTSLYRPVSPPPMFRSLPARLYRFLLFRSRLPYSTVRSLAPLLVGNRTADRTVYDFRMRLSQRDILQTRILLDGVWEPVLTRWWALFTARSSVILDVGAHCGYYSLFARSVNPAAYVHAFEPNPVMCADFVRNLALNEQQHGVMVQQTAVADRDGFGDMFVRDVEPAAASMNELSVFDQRLSTPVTRLDSYLNEHGIDHVDLVKLDIEGAEVEAIAGMSDGLAAHRYGALLIETHSRFMADGGIDVLRRELVGHGYQVFRVGARQAVPLGELDPVPDFDQWLALAPSVMAEMADLFEGQVLQLPTEYDAIYEGVEWSPAGVA